MTRIGSRIAWLLVPGVLLMTFIYVWPMLTLLRVAFNQVSPTGAMIVTWSLSTFRDVFADSITFDVTLNSFRLAFTASIIALIFSYPIALFLFRTESKYRGLLAVLAIAPILVSSVVRMYGWLAILGDRGVVNGVLLNLGWVEMPIRMVYNWTGVTVGMAELVTPYMVLALLAGFGRLDRSIEEAARSLGASPFRTFLRITLPLSFPAIITAVGLGFLISISAYVTPKLLGGGRVFVLATEIYDESTTNNNWPVAAVLAIYMLIIMSILLAVTGFVARRIQR